jgi:hypothetical protein
MKSVSEASRAWSSDKIGRREAENRAAFRALGETIASFQSISSPPKITL